MLRFVSVPVLVNYGTHFQVGGFTVWWDTQLMSLDEKTVQQGAHIQVEVDGRWSLDESSEEYFLAGINSDDSVLVGLPAVKYDHIHNLDQFEEISQDVYNEIDEHRNRVIPVLEEYKKVPMVWYCLKFPPRPGMTGVKLSVREIYQSDSLEDDTSLDLTLFPVTSYHNVTGRTTTWWATWNVVVHDTGAKPHDRKRGKPEGKKISKAAAQAAKYAAALYGSGGRNQRTNSTAEEETSQVPDQTMS